MDIKVLLIGIGLFFCILLIPVTGLFFFNPLFGFAGIVITILLCEVLFRVIYRWDTGKAYSFIPKVPFRNMYFEPHPYLPYVYKKHFTTQKRTKAIYPLNKDKGYYLDQKTTNELRYVNGSDGSREITIPKPQNLIRINCVGASTTGNSLGYQGSDYTYPSELEKILQDRCPDLDIEVNNCGIGGRSTAEILIDFLLTNIDTDPDYLVIYHAYNDLIPSLTPGFQSDYSHAKRNLGETYHIYRWNSYLPDIPLALYNCMINVFLLGSNIRYTLLNSVSRGKVDISLDFQGLGTYERNIDHIINICKANGIQVILSTFCCYLYSDIEKNPLHLKYYQGVLEENKVIKKLAEKHNLPIVDNFSLVPSEERYFVDSIHFSHEGMTLLAKNISELLIDNIKKKAL